MATPPPGLYPQLYLDAGKGVTDADAGRYAAALSALGVPGLCWHSGPRRLPSRWSRLARICQDHGVLALASWGLDGTTDTDGSPLTAQEKGDLCGHVLALPSCAAGLLDAEGRWDAGAKAPGMKEADALVLGKALRAVAPQALVGDQPWFAMLSHSSVRAVPRPNDAGGPLAGFPVDEFAVTAVNWMRFRQAYCNDFTGTDRYRRCVTWMNKDWTLVDAALLKAGLSRPLGVTFQAYGWDNLPDLNEALLDWSVTRQQPVFLWSEPFPADYVLAAMRFVGVLVRLGHAGASVAPHAAVRSFQADYNKTCAVGKKLAEDGRAGSMTMAAAGCPSAIPTKGP